MNSKLKTYQQIYDGFQQKNCELLMNEAEFNNISNKTHTKLPILSSCKHKSLVQFCHFKNYNSGVLCKECSNIKVSNIIKGKSKQNDVSVSHITEYNAKKIFIKNLETHFIIKNANDGCQADLIVKPIYTEEDKWLKIQIKSTEKPSHIYQFHNRQDNYDNCLMALICLSNEYIWLLPFEVIKGKTRISIGIKNSIYNKYLMSTQQVLYESLLKYYSSTLLFDEESCMTPISIHTQLEYKYRLIREKELDFLHFEKPKYENMVYDFIINGKTFQEKIITINEKWNKNGAKLFLRRSIGGNNSKNRWYKLGDCDFYWISCQHTTIFYVIPEKIMLENNLISVEEKQGTAMIRLYPHYSYEQLTNIKSQWTFDYRFDYKDLDKNKLLKLIHEI